MKYAKVEAGKLVEFKELDPELVKKLVDEGNPKAQLWKIVEEIGDPEKAAAEIQILDDKVVVLWSPLPPEPLAIDTLGGLLTPDESKVAAIATLEFLFERGAITKERLEELKKSA